MIVTYEYCKKIFELKYSCKIFFYLDYEKSLYNNCFFYVYFLQDSFYALIITLYSYFF